MVISRCLMALLPLTLALSTQPCRGAEIPAAEVDAIVQASLKTWEVPGAALLIVHDDKVVYLKGYGVRDRESGQPVTPDTLFAIGSCTKAFTATAIGVLADELKMSWDDPVSKHVPFFRLKDPLADANVTLRDLLCHRTGLKRHDLLGNGAPWDRAEMIRRIAYLEPSYPFRTTWDYNNLMYVTAGYAAGLADGTSWETVVQTRLLDPLGMKQTSLTVRAVEKAENVARPYFPKAGKLQAIPWENIDNVGPTGSMNSTARDLAPWLRFQLGDGTFEGKRIISAANLDETHTPQMIIPAYGVEKELNPETLQKSYGLAWFIDDYRGWQIVSHTGGIGGFRCRILLVPAARLGIALLTNSGAGTSPASMPIACTYTLVDRLLDLPRRDWDQHYHRFAVEAEEAEKAAQAQRLASRHTGTKPSRELAAYVGDYDEPAYGRATIRLIDGRLWLHWSSFTDPLEHFHFDTFELKGNETVGEEEVVFHLNGAGEVASFDYLGVTFRKAVQQ
jgi:CubicO group peptidase (beta-lactamase class C family)